MRIENIASTWMCIQNMALAATADGFGIMPSVFREGNMVAVEKLLAIPEDYELTTILLIGMQGEVPDKKMGRVRPDFTCLYRNSFGKVVNS